MKLYRPVGEKELLLIEASGFRAFPPRLPGQPIFYPVLNLEYAREIASQWNTKDGASGYRGYVLQFEVEDEFIGRYEIHTVGARRHQELWVPAEELELFNAHLIGKINMIEMHG